MNAQSIVRISLLKLHIFQSVSCFKFTFHVVCIGQKRDASLDCMMNYDSCFKIKLELIDHFC